MSSEKNPYSSKFWCKSYDDFVPCEIDIELFSLADILKDTAKDYPSSLCYDFMNTTATYRQFEWYVNSFANFLVQNGIKKGDIIAIHLPNSPQYMITLYGAFYAGCTITGLSILAKPTEIIYQLSDSGAKVLVTLDSFYEEACYAALSSGKTSVKIVVPTNITDMMEISKVLVWLGKKLKKVPFGEIQKVQGIKYIPFKDVMNNYPSSESPDVKIDPEKDLCILGYTGGTTGPPKGAMLTHANLAANLQQTLKWIEKDAVKGSEIFMSAFPFFHSAGVFLCFGTVMYAGMQILVPDPRDINLYIKMTKKWKPSVLACVPTLYIYLMNEPKFRKLDLSNYRGYISGAAPFASETFNEFERLVGKNKVMELYGLTEASPIVSSNPYEGKRKIGSVGLPIPNTEVKIVDVEDRNKVVPIGEPGELVLRGPQIFKGYWNKPEETKKAKTEDGWFYTGDVVVMDEEGYITIADRTKDMIIVSGYKVFSVEVDDKIGKHPAIELCSTIGVPDPNKPGSELVKLFVKLKPGFPNNEETIASILQFARDNLSAYKVPKFIQISYDIPLTAVGKIDKKVLRTSEQQKAK